MKKRLKKEKAIPNKNMETEKRQNWGWRCLIFIGDNIYSFLYAFMLIILWIYLIINWDKCISMQFFSRFDGNNILFIVGIALTILPFYDIEGKGIRLRRRNTKSLVDKFQSADAAYQQEMLKREVTKLQSKKMINPDGGDVEQ